MKISDRIRIYAEYRTISVSSIEKKCGLSHGYFSHIRRSISDKVRTTLAQQYPDLNIKWLTDGEGEMLLSGSKKPSESERTRYLEMISSRQERILYLEAEVLRLQTEIDSLKEKTYSD